jgi:hypothetical protein
MSGEANLRGYDNHECRQPKGSNPELRPVAHGVVIRLTKDSPFRGRLGRASRIQTFNCGGTPQSSVTDTHVWAARPGAHLKALRRKRLRRPDMPRADACHASTAVLR